LPETSVLHRRIDLAVEQALQLLPAAAALALAA